MGAFLHPEKTPTQQEAAVANRETLADLLRLAMSRLGATSGRDFDRKTTQAGRRITYTVANDILRGRYQAQRAIGKTLDTIADFAGVPANRVRVAAGLPPIGNSFRDQLPDDVDILTPAERDVVLAMIKILIDSHRSPRAWLLNELPDNLDESEMDPLPPEDEWLAACEPEPDHHSDR